MPQMHQNTSITSSTAQHAGAEQNSESTESLAANPVAKKGATKVPAWRRIEALKERRELNEALSDIWAEDPEFDDEWLGIDDADDELADAELIGDGEPGDGRVL